MRTFLFLLVLLPTLSRAQDNLSEVSQESFKFLKEVARNNSTLQKNYQGRLEETLKNCNLFKETIPESSVKIHLGRFDKDGLGWWSQYKQATGLYRQVQEIHEKYELRRLEELGIQLDESLVEMKGEKLKNFVSADAEAREVERIFLAAVSQTEFPSLDYKFWLHYSPGTLLRHRMKITPLAFHQELSTYKFLRVVQFARKEKLGNAFLQHATERFLFDKFRKLNDKNIDVRYCPKIVSFYFANQIASLIQDDLSILTVNSAENLCTQIGQRYEALVQSNLVTDKDKIVQPMVIGKINYDADRLGIELLLDKSGKRYGVTLGFQIRDRQVVCEDTGILKIVLADYIEKSKR